MARTPERMWGLYNYDNLLGVFGLRKEARRYAEKIILTNETWRSAQRRGYLAILRVRVSPEKEPSGAGD